MPSTDSDQALADAVYVETVELLSVAPAVVLNGLPIGALKMLVKPLNNDGRQEDGR